MAGHESKVGVRLFVAPIVYTTNLIYRARHASPFSEASHDPAQSSSSPASFEPQGPSLPLPDLSKLLYMPRYQ